MASLTIRDLDDDTKRRLRLRAAERGVSMEAEARGILRDAVRPTEPSDEKPGDWYRRLRAAVEEFGGVDLDPYLPDRRTEEQPPTSRRPPFADDPAGAAS